MIIWILTAAMFASKPIDVKELDKLTVFENIENCQTVNDAYYKGAFVCVEFKLD